jgi:hypothetical protein
MLYRPMHRALTFFGHCSSLGPKPHETQNPVPGLALKNKIISSSGFGLENYAWFLRASWVGKLHLVLESFLSWKTTLGSSELPCQVNIQYLQVDEASALTTVNDLWDLHSNTLKCTQSTRFAIWNCLWKFRPCRPVFNPLWDKTGKSGSRLNGHQALADILQHPDNAVMSTSSAPR